MDASVQLNIPSFMPYLLLKYAREAHGEVQQGYDSRREPLVALLLVAMTGEALVNRMLEPLLSTQDWIELERAGLARKWTRLSSELELKPALVLDEAPLLDFLRTVESRNAVMHFKHGKNVQQLEDSGPLVSAALPLEVSQLYAINTVAEDALRPENATHFYPSLENLLRIILPAYRKHDSGLVFMLEHVLDGKALKEVPLRATTRAAEADELAARINGFTAASSEARATLRDRFGVDVDVQGALERVLALDDPFELLSMSLTAGKIVELLSDIDLRALQPVQVIELSESLLPDGVPRRLEEQIVKVKGELWEVHKYDADPFPSNPHAHHQSSGLKLHLGTGELFNKRRRVGKVTRKNLDLIRARITAVELPPIET